MGTVQNRIKLIVQDDGKMSRIKIPDGRFKSVRGLADSLEPSIFDTHEDYRLFGVAHVYNSRNDESTE